MSTEISENDLRNAEAKQPVEEAHPLHILQKEIAAMPAIDTEKVEAVKRKLLENKLAIMGSEEERLASAEKIAQQIIAEILPSEK
jgi:hypothetical protein